MSQDDDLTVVAQAMVDEELTLIVRQMDDAKEHTAIEQAALKELSLRGLSS